MVMACGYAKITSGVAMNRKDTLIEEKDAAFPEKDEDNLYRNAISREY